MKLVKFLMVVVAAMAIALAVTFPWVTALVVITWALMGISIALIDKGCDHEIRKGWRNSNTTRVIVSAFAGPLWIFGMRWRRFRL